MRRSSEWGGAIEIQVACNLYSFRIIVRNKRDNTNIEFLPVNMNYNKTNYNKTDHRYLFPSSPPFFNPPFPFWQYVDG